MSMAQPSKKQPEIDQDETVEEQAAELVCFCHGVPKALIEQAIRNGATTLEAVRAQTKASTGCGGCTCIVEEILAKLAPKPPSK